MPPLMQLYLTPRRVRWIVGVAILLFTVASLAGQYWRLGLHHHSGAWIIRQFSLDDELNLPTAYQAITLGCAALLLWIIAYRERQLQHRGVAQWAILGCIFLLLACDEAFRIHERTGQFRDALPMGLGRRFRTGWIMFALFFVTVVGLSYLRFLFRLPRNIAYLFIVAGAIYVTGAMGMEIIVDPWVEAHGRLNMTYQLLATLEEVMEMTGVGIFLYALTSFLAPFSSRLLRIERDSATQKAEAATNTLHAPLPHHPYSPL
jgi:hypothetical protein